MKSRAILATLTTAALVAGGLALTGCDRSSGNAGGDGVAPAEQPKNPDTGETVAPTGSGSGNDGMKIDG